MNNGSWILNPLLRNERLLHSAMAVLMAFSIAVGFLFQNRIAQSVASIQSDREQCVRLCQSETKIRSDVEKSQERYAELDREYRSLLSSIRKRVVDSEVLSTLRGLSQKANCSLIDFRPGTMQKQINYQSRSFDLHLEGGFKSLFQFFESLQQISIAYQIGRFKIAESSSSGGPSRLDIELRVVFDYIEKGPL